MARYPNFVGLDLKWLFIATWNEAAPFTHDKSKVVTFQSILATDGIFSFAIFYYNKIEYSNGNNGHAKVGFDVGDGVNLALVEGSCTPEIINITQMSNMGQPGKFIFRIDNTNISTSNCDAESYEDGKQKLIAAPSFVSDIARSVVSFRGPCFPLDANVTCIFDTINHGIKETTGFVEHSLTDSPIAYCQTPYFYAYGRYLVKIRVQSENHTSNYEAFLTVSDLPPEFQVEYEKSYNNPEANLVGERLMKVTWDPAKFDENDKLDFGLIWTNPDTEDYEDLLVIASGFNNTGNFSKYFVPILPAGVTMNQLERAMGSFYLRSSTTKRGLGKIIKKAIQSSFEYIAELWGGVTEFLFCNDIYLGDVVDNVLPCPCTREQIDLDCNFEKDSQPQWMIDFFHPGGVASFRQITSGSGAQCIYDANGQFMAGPPGGGTADKYGPLDSKLGHFVHDVATWFGCCKMSSHCDKYYEYRPSYECSNDGCRPSQGNGDPHITTFDLFQYTFNGNGEFVMVEDALNNEFEVQARMEQFGTNDATVFTAFAIRHLSTVVQIQISNSKYKNDVLVDGISIEQDIASEPSLATQNFHSLMVRADADDWSRVSVFLTSGLSFRITTSDSVMSIISSANKKFERSNRFRGLLGDFDGDKSNDFKTSDGTLIESSANMSTIHWDFGMKWMVEQATDSLFHYGPGKSFASYYKPAFVPKFNVPDPSTMPQEALDVCGDSFDCLFDYEATGGDLAFVNETVKQNVVFNQTVEVADTIVRVCPNVPKVENGKYSATNANFPDSIVTYSCKDGYTMSGSNSVNCDNSTLTWLGNTPTCTLVGEPEIPSSGLGEITITFIVLGCVGAVIIIVAATATMVSNKKRKAKKRSKDVEMTKK